MPFAKRTAGAAAALSAGMLIGSYLSIPPAQAGYVVTLEQQGPNVVATGSGMIDTVGLSFFFSSFQGAGMQPIDGLINTGPNTGPAGTEPVDIYLGFNGPASFGSGVTTTASAGSGEFVGIDSIANELYVPAGYVSGNPLSDNTTYNNATFTSLGVTPGAYVWTWGSGADADTFTLQIGPAPPAVPEPSSLVLLAAALAGLPLVRISRWTIPKISK